MFPYNVVLITIIMCTQYSLPLVNEGDQCSLNDGTQGICKFITACQAALELLLNGTFPDNFCGVIGTQSMFCCKDTGFVTKPTSLPTLTGRPPGEVSEEKPENCTLITGETGKCLNIYNCSYALSLLKKNVRPKTCGFEGKDPRVCCIEEKPGALSLSKCSEFYPSEPSGSEPPLAKEFAHVAAIGFGKKDNIMWLCGGSLISKNFILTAAHCSYAGQKGSAKWVRLGDLDLTTDTDTDEPQTSIVKRVIVHPDYRLPSRYHDIALIELDGDVKLSAFVAIACLDTVRQHEEKQMIATGWHKTDGNAGDLSFLHKVNLDIVAHDKCQQNYKAQEKILPNGIVDDMYICAGGNEDEADCQTNSGGPLQLLERNQQTSVYVYKIVGVTSFGRLCTRHNFPSVYIRVYNYLSWIENTVWPLQQ